MILVTCPTCDGKAVTMASLDTDRFGGRICTTDACAVPFRHLAHSMEHQGQHVWKNNAEMVWECDDACPHSDHDVEGT